MSPSVLRSGSLVTLVLLVLAAVPSQAEKRRAVAHPEPAALVKGTVKGTVRDSVTGLPVINALVSAGEREARTSSSGEFDVGSTQGYGSIPITVVRTGYRQYSTALTAGGGYDLAITLEPTATVTVRTTGGITYQVDFESVGFGFSIGFSQYQGETVEFCRADGTRVSYDRYQIRRIVGPAVPAQSSACCNQPLLKINVEVRGQTPLDLNFADRCRAPESSMDLIARDHITGFLRYIPFAQITEVLFP